jgi:hypothetical protein
MDSAVRYFYQNVFSSRETGRLPGYAGHSQLVWQRAKHERATLTVSVSMMLLWTMRISRL